MIGFIFQKELILTKQMHQKCDICHYWYFLDKNFKYESYLCNGCHDLMQKAFNFNDVAIVSVKGGLYRIHFWYKSKYDAINVMKNSMKKVDHCNFFIRQRQLICCMGSLENYFGSVSWQNNNNNPKF